MADNINDTMNSIDNKMGVIINLLMKKEEMSIKEKVALLENISISYKEAARIIGISEKHYGKEKSLLSKGKNNKTQNIDGVNIGNEGENGTGTK